MKYTTQLNNNTLHSIRLADIPHCLLQEIFYFCLSLSYLVQDNLAFSTIKVYLSTICNLWKPTQFLLKASVKRNQENSKTEYSFSAPAHNHSADVQA